VDVLLSQGYRAFVFNLKEGTLMDSSGLAALTSVKRAVQTRGGAIKLNLPARIHSLLVTTKLMTLFDVFESESDAEQFLSGGPGSVTGLVAAGQQGSGPLQAPRYRRFHEGEGACIE
jgi:hypothetical protein